MAEPLQDRSKSREGFRFPGKWLCDLHGLQEIERLKGELLRPVRLLLTEFSHDTMQISAEFRDGKVVANV